MKLFDYSVLKMKVLVVFSSFLFVAAWAYPKSQEELQFKRIYVDPKSKWLPTDVSSRITGGEEAVPHSIPYQAYLIFANNDSSGWLCGGSLISEKHVLTAGHCVNEAVSVSVYLGAHTIRPLDSTTVVLQSENFILHEEFDEVHIFNDIGLIVLDEPVQFNENISAAALPSNDSNIDYEGEIARVSGWGRTEGDEDISPVLRQANGIVISNVLCDAVFANFRDSQLCTLGDHGKGTCKGDSGGPLVADDVQIGIVSYGAVGCPAGYPSGFTRITSYLDWIAEKTGLNF